MPRGSCSRRAGFAGAIRLVASLIVLVPAGDCGERVRETQKRSANALAGPWQSRLRLDRAWFGHGGSGLTRGAPGCFGMGVGPPRSSGRGGPPPQFVVGLPRAVFAPPPRGAGGPGGG